MEPKYIAIGIAIVLLIGAGTGYILSPKTSTSPELENQLDTHQKTIRTLENNNLELNAVLASTESENSELRETLNEAKELFESFQEKIDMFESGFGSPVFDSGWRSISPGETIFWEHGLGTDEDLFVYVVGRWAEGQTNQLYYGLGYLAGVEIGNGWDMDDTLIRVTRGVADVHWDETRVYIWNIPQGQADQTSSAETSTETDVKYIEIDLSGDELEGYRRIIDLEGYTEVTITWLNEMKYSQVVFWWDIKKSDGTYEHVGALFAADYEGGNYLQGSETDPIERIWTGSEGFKVGSKYLNIFTNGFALDVNERVKIVIIARK